MLPAKLAVSFAQVRRIIARLQPHAVICAGAYISYPVGMVAASKGVPLVLMESNAYPGLVTRKLTPKATQIHVAFEDTIPILENLGASRSICHVSGNPVRSIFNDSIDKAEARRHFGLDPERPTLFAFGGSLGARSINRSLDAIAEALIVDGAQLIWQTGTNYEGGDRNDPHMYRSTFVHEMQMGYAAADLVLARAGATTAAELATVGKPSVLVPLPIEKVHQRENAEAMEKAGAAEMMLDDELPQRLYLTLTRLLGDPETLASMGAAASGLAVADADDQIARKLIEFAV
jgi:UDP-N-acetylglucosamine--N-acetylmuramyl-(pentapeptide) pyrophosphoryl-undecaprenol N-acetylglucosamine transferase